MFAHRAGFFPEGVGKRAAHLSDPSAHPADDVLLIRGELVGFGPIELLSKQHPRGHHQREPIEQRREVEVGVVWLRGNLGPDHAFERGETVGEGAFAERGGDERLEAVPLPVGLGEEVLSDAEPDRISSGRWTGPRVSVGDEHRASHVGVGEDPCGDRPEAQSGERTEGGRTIEPGEAVGVERSQAASEGTVDSYCRQVPHAYSPAPKQVLSF